MTGVQTCALPILTGAYGVAGDFAKIPPLVFQAERATSKGLPWQLHVHCAQAHLALGQNREALVALSKARAVESVPIEARAALDELEAEATTPVPSEAKDLH